MPMTMPLPVGVLLPKAACVLVLRLPLCDCWRFRFRCLTSDFWQQQHKQLGWEEEQKAGGSDQEQCQYRVPSCVPKKARGSKYPCAAFAIAFFFACVFCQACAICFCVKSFWPRTFSAFLLPCLIICIIFVCFGELFFGFWAGVGNCTLIPREWREERAMSLIQFAIPSPHIFCGVP